MTDFVGRCRAALDEAGRRKGRALELLVRVPGSLDAGLASHGRHCHSTLPLYAAIGCRSLRIYAVILQPLLSFSARMTVSPSATMRLDLSGRLSQK